MKIVLSSLSLALLALSGCAMSPSYRCPIDGSKTDARCTSTEEAYRASTKVKPGASKTISVFDAATQGAEGQARSEPYFTGQATNYPAPPGNGAPVFNQPKVFQPWLAPYVDAEGNLRSGEYGYFSTPGRWNYGGLRKAGNSSGIFQPARPDNLGFNPVAPATSKPAAPPLMAPTNSPVAPAAQTPTAVSNITQPYQKLTQ